MEQGFRLGFDYSSHSCRSAGQNMRSALEHPEPINEYLSLELGAGCIIGPLPKETEGIQVSRFGVIPKPHQPGKWRLITDLSSPPNSSVNDGINPRLCSLSYASVDDAVQHIVHFGSGAMLAKFDIASAYRVVPVHPQDMMLLGMAWNGQLYVDGALPFKLRSAPKLFSAVADAFLWIMGRHGVTNAIHYLDDFLVVGAPQSTQCSQALAVSLQLCKKNWVFRLQSVSWKAQLRQSLSSVSSLTPRGGYCSSLQKSCLL